MQCVNSVGMGLIEPKFDVEKELRNFPACREKGRSSRNMLERGTSYLIVTSRGAQIDLEHKNKHAKSFSVLQTLTFVCLRTFHF